MCDNENSQPKVRDSLDIALAGYREDWASVARYSVFRSQYNAGGGEKKKVLHTNVTLSEARRLVGEINTAISLEPGYRPGTMGRPMGGFELENNDETLLKYRKIRAERELRGQA